MDLSGSPSRSRRYLEPEGPLKPANAAVALITRRTGALSGPAARLPSPTIFFPDQWGCFGGALEPRRA